jgi:MGT family glycosyltransferase
LRNRALQWAVEHVVFKDPIARYHETRRALGFPRSPHSLFDHVRTADVYLQTGAPSFEYPRSDMPPQVRFIGSFVPEPPAEWERPDWWGYLDRGKPVVLVTQGTVANDYDDLIRPAIRALADEDLFVVVTTGSKPASEVKIDPLPSNVRVERFVPYAHLMPKVDFLLTNGGYGSVQIALTNGVPVASFGASEEKPEIANRIQWSGVGLGVKSKTPTEDQILTTVRQILADPSYRAKARAMQAELARSGAGGGGPAGGAAARAHAAGAGDGVSQGAPSARRLGHRAASETLLFADSHKRSFAKMVQSANHLGSQGGDTFKVDEE